MITLHRLGHDAEPFLLNPDLIVTAEATPDTVVHLATGARMLVSETPDEIVAAVLDWRVSVRRGALRVVTAEELHPATDHSRR